MGQLGRKLRTLQGGKVAFWCPACDSAHHVSVAPPAAYLWSFNNDGDKPTFSPSVLLTYNRHEPPVTFENLEEYRKNPWPQVEKKYICHSFVTNGRIQYLGDCTHSLAGQTVELPDWPQPFKEE